ncbi:hypothetical protein OOK29_25925 [Streptomyces phaeochromogenes]|uniref:hypothetical protein n=1 Tax=Streptomyces phaeochromogenes TaxID=1923 RepID=UPI00224EF9DA|nr:hypothetical protein [Streptomyces phaeochromogenes]MCX5601593.1 hypothetical protein [Streptomyces phaeochromogenes]
MSKQQSTPVDQDANATIDELLARAAQDLTNAVAARVEKQKQGDAGAREGILPGGGH